MKPLINRPKTDTCSDDWITDPSIPAIAKEMHCGANFEYKFNTKVFYRGKKLDNDELQRLYNEIMNL